ncbi:hypothetical protein PFISCL1PPCAC_6484, partial [Pristionchus fissidentatus]
LDWSLSHKMRALIIFLIYLITIANCFPSEEDWQCDPGLTHDAIYNSGCRHLTGKINRCCKVFSNCMVSEDSDKWCLLMRQDCLDAVIMDTGRMECIRFTTQLIGDRPEESDVSDGLQLS